MCGACNAETRDLKGQNAAEKSTKQELYSYIVARIKTPNQPKTEHTLSPR